jgi:hypothetical protein
MALQWVLVVHELEHTNDAVPLYIAIKAFPVYQPLIDIAGLDVTAKCAVILLVKFFDKLNGLFLP